jgi:large subunit ribosomal protein L3
MNALLGKKLGMTQIFEESGTAIPVSVIQAGPCRIIQVKTPETDGYSAIQIGFEEIPERKASMPQRGHCKRANSKPHRILKEVRVEDPTKYKVGEAVDVGLFEDAAHVHVAGVVKGRGFTGVTKRHNFKGGRKTHGSHLHRAPGSVGMCATPARIFKGKKMPGRMGGNNSTTRNLKVVQIDKENNLLFVKGSIPGATNGTVFIRKA